MTARDLPAGRALDAEVAETALGFRVERIRPAWYGREVLCFYRPGSPEMAYSYDDNACNAMMFRNGVDDSAGYALPLPRYHDDTAEAFTVLEALRADGRIIMASVSVGENGWWCALYPPLGYGCNSVESEYCETAALAICRASLALMERAR